jgi:hypothetical protein
MWKITQDEYGYWYANNEELKMCCWDRKFNRLIKLIKYCESNEPKA